MSVLVGVVGLDVGLLLETLLLASLDTVFVFGSHVTVVLSTVLLTYSYSVSVTVKLYAVTVELDGQVRSVVIPSETVSSPPRKERAVGRSAQERNLETTWW